MSSSYNSKLIQANDIAYKPNLLDVSASQASEETSRTGFSEALKQALQFGDEDTTAKTPKTPQPSTQAESDDVAIEALVPAAVDLGLGLASGNPIATGLAGKEILQSVFKADIEAQFTQLGQNIASALIAGLSGDPRATQVAASAEELATQAALAGGKAVSEGETNALAVEPKTPKRSATAANSGDIKTQGTIPKAILESQLKA